LEDKPTAQQIIFVKSFSVASIDGNHRDFYSAQDLMFFDMQMSLTQKDGLE
jgi:hypothetical protein